MPLLVVWNLPCQLGHEMGTLRTRTDKTHFAAQNIPKLRYLIYPNLANNSAHARGQFVSCARPYRAICLSVYSHRAKFSQDKRASVFPNAFLLVKNRPPRIELDQDRRQHNNRERQHHGYQRYESVHCIASYCGQLSLPTSSGKNQPRRAYHFERYSPCNSLVESRTLLNRHIAPQAQL